jgi:hypothetical protein
MTDIAESIDKHHENKKQSPRFHFGVSSLGEKCERKIWMNFRWCKDPQFSGRILRLFRRGHLEELTIAQDLIDAGFEVSNYGEDQSKVDFGCHVSSEVDGIVNINGIKMVLECKTSSDKQFQKLKKEGIRKAKWQHYVQCNVYCYGLGVSDALYYVINKNTDEIYTEFITADFELAEKYIERGQRLATQDELPEPISTNPSWFECKFCDYHSFCHKKEPVVKEHCRTCAYSTSKKDSTWFCEKTATDIGKDKQLQGCTEFELHDHLKEK